MNKEYNKLHFNKWSKFYDKDIIWGRYFSYGYDQVIKILNKDVNKDKKKVILDIGCGTGELEYKLTNFCQIQKIVAIDFSEKMLNIAKLKNDKKKVNFILSDLDKIRFSNQSFDVIIILNVLHHTQDLNLLLKNISDWIRPDGLIFVLDPIYDNLLKKFWCILLKYVLIPEKSIKYYSLKDMLSILKKYNLNLIGSKNIFYFSKLLLISKL
ncbi:MAG: methyltransferase domain-containing protein [bacterium]|nr:methyltransferase domain-containing protein [bacterium]